MISFSRLSLGEFKRSVLEAQTEEGLIGKMISNKYPRMSDADCPESTENFELRSQIRFLNTYLSWHVIWKMCGGLKKSIVNTLISLKIC